MPELPLVTLQTTVLACNTGPEAGLTDTSRNGEQHDT